MSWTGVLIAILYLTGQQIPYYNTPLLVSLILLSRKDDLKHFAAKSNLTTGNRERGSNLSCSKKIIESKERKF